MDLHQLAAIQKAIAAQPRSITLLAVSKKKPVQEILLASENGLKDFGENYSQEFLEKYSVLKNYPFNWHFIGHLQRRKVKDILGKVSLIHSIDSFQLLHEIHSRLGNLTQKVLLQINLSKEKTKAGLFKDEVPQILQQAQAFKNIQICGLMTLPPFKEDPEETRPFFQELQNLLNEMNRRSLYSQEMTELSMGMSHDYEVALEEGSTILRIGQALFGKREK